MPTFVDRIEIVNDKSKDSASEIVMNMMKSLPAISLPPTKAIESNRYNRAELVVKENNEKEKEFFAPSEVVDQPFKDCRSMLINRLKNSGVGSAIARGYKWCKDHDIDCAVVMARNGFNHCQQ